MKKSLSSQLIIASTIFITMLALSLTAGHYLYKTIFQDADLLFEGLVLSGLSIVSLLACVAVITINELREKQGKIIEIMKEMNNTIIRLNMTSTSSPINIFDLLKRPGTSSTITNEIGRAHV